MLKTWRLIPPIHASGTIQMAIDEWLLEQHRLGHGPPCLRFYTWNPVAISLGYHQRQYPQAWHHLQWNGHKVDLVRRPSGGRAVLHQGDLTYSIITSGYQGRRRDIYADLCRFLIEGWKRLGISLILGADTLNYQRSASCFDTTTAADLVMNNGYKLIGSAQLYREHCILQHGSMRLKPEPDLVQQVFGQRISSPNSLSQIQTTTIIEALTNAIEDIGNIKLEQQPLLHHEQQQAVTWKQRQKNNSNRSA